MWSSVERKVEHLESRLNISADNFVEEEERPTRASLIEGLANISDISQWGGILLRCVHNSPPPPPPSFYD